MPNLSSDQAYQLASQFHDLSVAVGNYRFAHWDQLSAAERRRLEDLQWTLMNYSSDFTAQAISMVVDDLQGTLSKIRGATAQANKVINDIEIVSKVLVIAASAAVLGAAIMSGNAEGALEAAGELAEATGS
jgi:hypothetical protein